MKSNDLHALWKALTGWQKDPGALEIWKTCKVSRPNWYAYVGLMETFLIIYSHGSYYSYKERKK